MEGVLRTICTIRRVCVCVVCARARAYELDALLVLYVFAYCRKSDYMQRSTKFRPYIFLFRAAATSTGN